MHSNQTSIKSLSQTKRKPSAGWTTVLLDTLTTTANKLRAGGFFGELYKGVLSNGKKIFANSHGENEFIKLAKLQHRCLIKLLDFSLEKEERLLIYKFIANGSLERVLFDQENQSKLDWECRCKIIKSVARGILYLHEDSCIMVIHRDLKSSNILLDEEMNAKISDFGSARLLVSYEGIQGTRICNGGKVFGEV